jgi:hypothetical protein
MLELDDLLLSVSTPKKGTRTMIRMLFRIPQRAMSVLKMSAEPSVNDFLDLFFVF